MSVAGTLAGIVLAVGGAAGVLIFSAEPLRTLVAPLAAAAAGVGMTLLVEEVGLRPAERMRTAAEHDALLRSAHSHEVAQYGLAVALGVKLWEVAMTAPRKSATTTDELGRYAKALAIEDLVPAPGSAVGDVEHLSFAIRDALRDRHTTGVSKAFDFGVVAYLLLDVVVRDDIEARHMLEARVATDLAGLWGLDAAPRQYMTHMLSLWDDRLLSAGELRAAIERLILFVENLEAPDTAADQLRAFIRSAPGLRRDEVRRVLRSPWPART